MKSYKNIIANHKHLLQRARLHNWSLTQCYHEHYKLMKNTVEIITDQQMINEMENKDD